VTKEKSFITLTPDVLPNLFEGISLKPLLRQRVQPEEALAVEGEFGQEEPGLRGVRIEDLTLPDFRLDGGDEPLVNLFHQGDGVVVRPDVHH
jgi:hypothetical protein